jgi:hypothetical protein
MGPRWSNQLSLPSRQTPLAAANVPAAAPRVRSARHLPPKRSSSDVYSRYHACRADMFRQIKSGESAKTGIPLFQRKSSLNSAPKGINEEEEELEKDAQVVIDECGADIMEDAASEKEHQSFMMKDLDLQLRPLTSEGPQKDLDLQPQPREMHVRTQAVLKLNLGSNRVDSIIEEESFKGFMVTDV